MSDPIRVLGVAVAMGSLLASACDSSSSSSTPSVQRAQAIDGYLVGAEVLCDGEPGGTTGAAGSFSCPAATELFRVNGGKDVSFDATETEDGRVFIGELAGPSTLDYVTPLSTIVVALATVDDAYDASRFDESAAALRTALGVDDLDLNANAAEVMQNVRLNAQINNIIAEFSTTGGEYSTVMSTFARTLRSANSSGTKVSLTSGIRATLDALNKELIDDNGGLAKTPEDLETTKGRVQVTNSQIEQAEQPDAIGLVTGGNRQPPANAAITIDRDIIGVSFKEESGAVRTFSLADFESKAQSSGAYTISVDKQLAAISVDRAGLAINRTLANEAIQLGFRLEAVATDDTRQLSVATSDAVLSMSEGETSSIEVSVPDGSEMNVTAVDSEGTSTNATFVVDGDETFSSENDFVQINLGDIEQRLLDKGIEGFLDESGDYKVTMLVGGVSVRQTDGGLNASLEAFTIVADELTVNGEGFQGYASFR